MTWLTLLLLARLDLLLAQLKWPRERTGADDSKSQAAA